MMYEFLERLISVALPRERDFRGLSFKSFDGRGNYNFGIKEQIIFTEIEYDKIESIRGLNVTITTTAKTDDEAYQLLKLLGFPLREKPVNQEVEEAAWWPRNHKFIKQKEKQNFQPGKRIGVLNVDDHMLILDDLDFADYVFGKWH